MTPSLKAKASVKKQQIRNMLRVKTRIVFILLLVISISACTSKSGKIESEKPIEKTKSILIKNEQVQPANGLWGEKNGNFALFEIKGDTICYLDEEDGCYKLKFDNDNVTIFYDGFNEKYTYKFDSLDNILILKNKNSNDKLYRFKQE
jgi:hypothetical protein